MHLINDAWSDMARWTGIALRRTIVAIATMRSIRAGGLVRERFEQMVARNGGAKIKALTALSRRGSGDPDAARVARPPS